MKKLAISLSLFLMHSFSSFGFNPEDEKVITDFLNLRFGMFIHYNMGTYHQEQWAYPFHDPKSFKPTNLDCSQWAEGAKSAGMRYAVFTAKHHDGFCLWDSSVTGYDIANTDYPKLDLVKEYVEAFRKAGIKPGLYFSVMDWHHGINKGTVNPENIIFMKKQFTELLTNYGEILCIVIDGWGSKWGGPTFKELPFDVLANHIHSIQPNCLVINHSCNTSLEETQIVHYEATHGQHCPFDNTIPSQQGPTLQKAWFWEPGFEKDSLKSITDIKNELNFANSHYTNYLLNVSPNDKGRLDKNVMDRLHEIGQQIKVTEEKITSLPTPQPVNKGVTVTASSERKGYEARHVIDANLHTNWQFSENDNDRWIELDFGKPVTFNKVICGEFYSQIKQFRIEALIDNKWIKIVDGDNMGVNFHATFNDITSQKYRLTVIQCEGIPLLSEITFVRY